MVNGNCNSSSSSSRNGESATTIVKNRFLRFLIWQSLQSTVVYLFFKYFLFSLLTGRNRSPSGIPFLPSLAACLTFLAFHLALLIFSFSLFAIASPQPHRLASVVEIFFGLIHLVFVSGGQPLPPNVRRRAKISLYFLLFAAASAFSGCLALLCVCWNCFDGSFAWKLGFRGGVVGFLYGLAYFYQKRWALEFPIIQRPPFFSFKIGLPLAAQQALKLSSAAYLSSAVLAVFLPYDFKGGSTIGKFIIDQIALFIGTFVVFLCWELNHRLHQVLHTRRFVFAPPKGSAAAETNPSEPLLAALEESPPASLIQYLAYLDLCMVCENNVDTWRRAAFFEETGETYKRVMAACLRPLEQLALKLGEGLESNLVEKSFQLGKQLRSTTNGQPDSTLHETFYDFQLCAWCARIVASLTVHSRKEDRFGVAQLSGKNADVMSTLLSCLLAVETLMGKKINLQNPQYLTGPAGIKWATQSSARKEATANGLTGKRRGNPLYTKAYSMADILKTSIYCIVSAFHDEMTSSAKAGLIDKEWITSSKPSFGTRELLLQKLRLFLEFRAN